MNKSSTHMSRKTYGKNDQETFNHFVLNSEELDNSTRMTSFPGSTIKAYADQA